MVEHRPLSPLRPRISAWLRAATVFVLRIATPEHDDAVQRLRVPRTEEIARPA
ncbi:hypothetical protein ORV05_15840 [Amycolatopsis cynarae]|uniref:GNAT family N-acetyltransferase n=1 Tax=Amycolatopsis cynarae TaxID=2995223 RepID=A0ABY7BB18_9PSEU|nr:hypothetical protein [Amycolatopsis sp. HUAS 11-8]WAL69170.1 hypothetical protein ORV05_15840 [Amycolatopsis sp. HUAS 11-8]